MFTWIKVAALMAALVLAAVLISCSDETNYDQRTVVYVASINDGTPFLCDVLNQGDSLYERDGVTYKTDDDYITEDVIAITFHNKPYNDIIDPEGSLGDFLVTDYEVDFSTFDGSTQPVQDFAGKTSIYIPAGEMVTGAVLLVPYGSKLITPLVDLMYASQEIMALAHFTFRGHEVQTDRVVEFEAAVTVNFADPLTTRSQQR